MTFKSGNFFFLVVVIGYVLSVTNCCLSQKSTLFYLSLKKKPAHNGKFVLNCIEKKVYSK